MSIKLLSHSVNETFEFGKQFAFGKFFKVEKRSIFLLKGELGSGKTSFVRGFCSFWKVDEYVSSPSFTIVNEYSNDKVKIIHIDFYRLKSIEEIEEIGFYELVQDADYTFIEWPNIVESSLENYYLINFSYGEKDNEREIEIIFDFIRRNCEI